MPKKIPERQCLGCRQMKPKTELIRVLKTPEGNICIDKTGKLNGRGAYICDSVDFLKKAIKSKGLERSFKVEIPQNIYDVLSKEMI